MVNVDEILKKYEARLEKEVGAEPTKKIEFTREYEQFKREAFKPLSRYEKFAKFSGAILKVKPSSKARKKFQKALDAVHSEITPEEAASLSVNAFILTLILSIGAFVTYILLSKSDYYPFMYLFLGIGFSVFLYYWLYSFPFIQAKKWRLKASSQIVQALLFIVIYMKHTPNLERAIRFASEHLQPPLSLDFKKIFWDVEVGKYPSIRESIDSYLETWRESSLEFVEAMHLIESSLYEPTEYKRISILEKSLKVMLEGVQEKMLNYTHEIKAPLTNIYMLGIVLPTLALALIPLASALLNGLLTWQHVIVLFNVIVPFFVYYMTSQVLLTRPTGYGEAELLEMHPNYTSYKSPVPTAIAFLVALPFFIIGIIPLLMLFPSLAETIGLADFNLPFFNIPFFDIKVTSTGLVGPFGLGAVILSLFLPFSISLFFAINYGMHTNKLIKTRKETKKLEDEYASALFQFGNRLSSGVPAEMAFGRVAEILHGSPTGKFFSLVNNNIQHGMSVREAIFNKFRGAIIYFPSTLIKTSMFILIEGVKKGLKIASESMLSIAEHAKNIHRIEERLKDLVADVVVSMKSNISFLAPILGGVVVGLAAMITMIINHLVGMMGTMQGAESELAGAAGGVMTLFSVENMIPPYFLQAAVGIYLIQIIFILTSTIVVIENGADKLTEKNEIAKNLYRGMSFYLIIALISILVLSLLASLVMTQVGSVA
ncbi:MAG: hypothetical protein DRM99_01230 [Thermoplasmata archaeon]|nr:MAG: hypothetical protein DRM99_01230 [Thermoplasmata archaeon]